MSSVSSGDAVIVVAEPATRLSDALATRKSFSAVNIASCALPTRMAERNESALIATLATSLVVDALSCSPACLSCA